MQENMSKIAGDINLSEGRLSTRIMSEVVPDNKL